jgi:hypothetical protein
MPLGFIRMKAINASRSRPGGDPAILNMRLAAYRLQFPSTTVQKRRPLIAASVTLCVSLQ